MSRYFSKLAKRTGIAPNRTEKIHRPAARAEMRSGFQPDERAPSERGLEANIEKIVSPAGLHPNPPAESSKGRIRRHGHQSSGQKDVTTSTGKKLREEAQFSVRENEPSHLSQADSVKTDSDDDPVAEIATFSENSAAAHSRQPRIRKGTDQQSKNMSEDDPQPHESSGNRAAEQNDDPDHALLMEKRQHVVEEKIIEVDTISPARENREVNDSRNDSYFAMPAGRIQKAVSPPAATIETAERTPPRSETRTVRIVSERGPTAASKLGKGASAMHNNSVDIRIGTISFEVHQAPEKKTAMDPPAPGPVVKQQMLSSKPPRLSRYYLKGI